MSKSALISHPLAPLALLLLLISLTACPTNTPATEAPSPDQSAYRQEIQDWQAERRAGMSNPDGWRALVGLDWLEPGTATVGGADTNDIVLPTENAPAQLGTLTIAGSEGANGDRAIRFQPADGVEVTTNEQPVTGEIALATDMNTDMNEDATVLEAGSLTLTVIERWEGDTARLALRSRDRGHPRLAHPPEVTFYPIDPAWRVEARFDRYDPPKQVPILNVLGMTADTPSPGTLVFEKDGSEYRIDALESGDELFLVFGDETNCHGTYCSGRYLYTEAPGEAGTVILDFNRAYDPPCAFTDFATCPLPPPQNELPLAVTAGEKYDKSYRSASGGHE